MATKSCDSPQNVDQFGAYQAQIFLPFFILFFWYRRLFFFIFIYYLLKQPWPSFSALKTLQIPKLYTTPNPTCSEQFSAHHRPFPEVLSWDPTAHVSTPLPTATMAPPRLNSRSSHCHVRARSPRQSGRVFCTSRGSVVFLRLTCCSHDLPKSISRTWPLSRWRSTTSCWMSRTGISIIGPPAMRWLSRARSAGRRASWWPSYGSWQRTRREIY